MWRQYVTSTKTTIITIRALTAIVAVFIAMYVIGRHFAVFGSYTLSYSFDRESEAITAFTPSGRASALLKNLDTGKTFQEISGEPVYMDVSVPRSFDSVDISLEYKNNDQRIIEFGAVANDDPWIVDLQPFEIAIIDEAIKDDWHVVSNEEYTILQKNQNYSSVEQFFSQFPSESNVYTYGVDIKKNVPHLSAPVADVSSSIEQPIVVAKDIQGAHTMLVQQPNTQEFKLHMGFSSVVEGDISVFWSDGTLLEAFPFNGSSAIVSVPRLEAGLYSVVITIDNESIIDTITSTTPYVVFERRLSFAIDESAASDIERNIDIAAGTISFIANDLDSEQEILVDESPNTIRKLAPYTIYTEKQDNSYSRFTPVETILQNGNVQIISDGYIAASEAVYFQPYNKLSDISPYTVLEMADYIVYTEYNSPSKNPAGKKQTISYDLSRVTGDRKNIQFALSSPGLIEEQASIRIEEIEFHFKRDALWSRFIDRFKN